MEIGQFGHFFNRKHIKRRPISIVYNTVNYTMEMGPCLVFFVLTKMAKRAYLHSIYSAE